MEITTIDIILSVEIDDAGRLHLKPAKTKFTLIYRTATEVHWDNKKKTLYSPKPREWSYLDWFIHITGVAKNECGTDLRLSDKTEWINIPEDVKMKITKAQDQDQGNGMIKEKAEADKKPWWKIW